MTRFAVSPDRPRTPVLPSLGIALMLLGAGCLGAGKEESLERQPPIRPIADVLAEHAPRLMELGGVTAVGEGRLADGTSCIRVFLLRRDRELEERIPKSIEGHPVDLQVTGEIRALPDSSP